MRKLIRWLLVIAAAVAGAYFLAAGAETKSTRASTDPPHTRASTHSRRRRAPVSAEKVRVPILLGAPSFTVAARQGIQELFDGTRAVAWNPQTGLWGGHARPNWWQSALIVQTLVRYLERTHNVSPFFQQVLLRVYERNVYKPLSTAKRDFANEFMDDTAWWGLAWLEASRYELYYRHDQADAARFLAVAEYDAQYIVNAPRECGGIVWALRRDPDMVTSAEFVSLAAKLASYRNTPGVFYDPQKAARWLTDARYVFDWLARSGMVDLRWGFVIDRIFGGCHKYLGGPLTYTEGEMADALTQLGVAMRQPYYFRLAARFIRYVLNWRSGLVAHGVIQEHCEGRRGACHHLRNRLDIPAYKGIFIQAVADWTQATGRRTFERFLHNQAAAVVDHAVLTPANRAGNCLTPDNCLFAFAWARPLDGAPPAVPVTPASQESAIDALTAVLPARSRG